MKPYVISTAGLKYLLLFLSLSLLYLSTACSKSEPVKIGFIAGISGRVADLGIAGRNGAQLAIEEWNAKGGLRGRRIELLVEDDGQDPDTAKKAFKLLQQKNLDVIVGPMTSSMAMELVPLANSSNILLVSPTVTTTQLSAIDDNFFRVIGPASNYAQKNAQYQYNTLGKRKASVIYDINNKAYSESWGNNFKNEFENLGGEVLLYRSFRSGKGVHFKSEAEKLLAGNPDAIQIVSNALDASMLIQQIRRLDPKIHLSISEWAATERLTDLGGKAVNGVFVAQFFDRNSQNPEFKAFHQAYLQRFGREPGFASVAGYDAMQVVLNAILNKKPNQSLKQTLLSLKTFSGVQGKVIFDRFGDARRPTYFSVIKDGHFETLSSHE